MYKFNTDYIVLDRFDKNIIAGFGTKKTGNGLDKNLLHKYFKDTVFVTPIQNHSTNIVEYKNGDEFSPNNCDGIITKGKKVMLTVVTADCLPIIYHDPIAAIIAVSHQGWKGTLDHLPSKMIEGMIKMGSDIKNIHCFFGPAINDCCYEIYGDRLNEFQKEFKSDFIFRKDKEKYFLNLYKSNYILLKKEGILPQNISYFPFCTSCDSGKFYSYNRDRKIAGEMVSFIMLQ